MLDGNVGVVKTVLGEISTPETQARLYSILGLLSGMGRLSGGLVGGWLSDIKTDIEYFNKYPFVLSCIISSDISLIGWIIAFFFLKETKESTIIAKQQKNVQN